MRLSRILFIILILWACNEESVDKSSQTTLITLNSVENLMFSDTYLMVTDIYGEILVFAQIKKDATYITNRSITGPINISLLSIFSNSYYLTTYTEIEINQTWDLPRIYFPPLAREKYPPTLININNISVNISNNFTFRSASSKIGSVLSETWDFNGSQVSMYIAADKKLSDDVLLVINDGIKSPKYLWMPESSYTKETNDFDFESDFKEMDNVLTFSFNNTISFAEMTITGYNNDSELNYQGPKGYIHSQYWGNNEINTFKGGYLNGFDFYRAYLSVKVPNKDYVYSKSGAPPESIDERFFKGEFEILNSSYNDFQFTAASDFDAGISKWRNPSSGSVWTIYHPATITSNVILKDFPARLKEIYPHLRLTNLDYAESEFINNIGGKGYGTYLAQKFKNTDGDKALREWYSIRKIN